MGCHIASRALLRKPVSQLSPSILRVESLEPQCGHSQRQIRLAWACSLGQPQAEECMCALGTCSGGQVLCRACTGPRVGGGPVNRLLDFGSL